VDPELTPEGGRELGSLALTLFFLGLEREPPAAER